MGTIYAVAEKSEDNTLNVIERRTGWQLSFQFIITQMAQLCNVPTSIKRDNAALRDNKAEEGLH